MAKHNDNAFKRALLKKRNKQKLIDATFQANMILTLTVLRDGFDFGTVRLERFIDKYQDLLDSCNKGYISVDDLTETLYEETGIRVGKQEVEKC